MGAARGQGGGYLRADAGCAALFPSKNYILVLRFAGRRGIVGGKYSYHNDFRMHQPLRGISGAPEIIFQGGEEDRPGEDFENCP